VIYWFCFDFFFQEVVPVSCSSRAVRLPSRWRGTGYFGSCISFSFRSRPLIYNFLETHGIINSSFFCVSVFCCCYYLFIILCQCLAFFHLIHLFFSRQMSPQSNVDYLFFHEIL
jgi:hypothetical protein